MNIGLILIEVSSGKEVFLIELEIPYYILQQAIEIDSFFKEVTKTVTITTLPKKVNSLNSFKVFYN